MPSLESSLFDYLKSRRLWTHESLLGDDAAVLPIRSTNLVVSADLLSDGVDFLLNAAVPEQVGRKALAVNLSDLAAMAAVPDGFTLSLAIPQNWPSNAFENLSALDYLKRFYDGLLKLADEFQIPLVGGDTNTFDGLFTISVCIFGHIPNAPSEPSSDLCRFHKPGTPWLRSSAQPGDAVLVTGPLGGSIFSRQFLFTPRVREALYLRERRSIHAAMDISDGLSLDLSRLAAQSGVGINLNLAAIPVHPDVGQIEDNPLNQNPNALYESPLSHALSDGEDFELILTAPPAEADAMIHDEEYRLRFGAVPVIIGEVIAQPGLFGDGKPLSPRGFEHKSA